MGPLGSISELTNERVLHIVSPGAPECCSFPEAQLAFGEVQSGRRRVAEEIRAEKRKAAP